MAHGLSEDVNRPERRRREGYESKLRSAVRTARGGRGEIRQDECERGQGDERSQPRARSLDAERLLMVDEAKNELYFAIAVGAASEALKNVRLKVGEGIAGHVAKYGERLIVPDVRADRRFGMLSEMRFAVAAGIVIVAVLSACVPVVSRRPGRTESRG